MRQQWGGMGGVWLLSLRHALHHRVQTGILMFCIAISLYLPVTSHLLMSTYSDDLTARADSTPLIMGARGNRFDLTLGVLYFRQSSIDPIPLRVFEDLREERPGVVIPMNTEYTARGYPIVGTSFDYFEVRQLTPAEGTLPRRTGDVVLGARVADDLDLTAGDTLFSDQLELYDIAVPPALRMRITGVLEPSHAADDTAVFVDLNTIWVIAGAAHGHADVTQTGTVDERLILGRGGGHTAVSPALIEYNEITDDNIASFHVHGDRDQLPLSAVLVFPRDEKTRTMLKARINAEGDWQMVVPGMVIDDLLAFVFRIKSLFDALSVMLAGCTVLMTVLVVLLSMRVRAGEIRTLNRIGCARHTVAALYASELLIIFACSVSLAVLAIAGTMFWLPNLVRVL
ncbi:MAG: ABC transporter permease [Planctomycetota bacterium]